MAVTEPAGAAPGEIWAAWECRSWSTLER